MKRLAIGLAALALPGALPALAGADLPAPGPNGQIAFTSGRDDGSTVLSDNLAQIWTTNPFGAGASRLSTETMADTLHHRHATWSPDHTKVAFARGSAFAGPFDIYVRDLVLGSTVALMTTTENEDRPAWSPDGTRIAYQRDLDNGAGANYVIETRPATGGSPTTIATNVDDSATNAGFFPRPHWTPDSETILYSKLDGADLHDIFRAPADGSNTTGTVVVNGTANDYQPEVSPAGDQICFTRETGGDKDVRIATFPGGAVSVTPLSTGGVDYECGWSPDTTRILFSRGGFGAGVLMVRDSDATGTVDTLANDFGNNRFDGNGDWAINFSPECENVTATVAVNGVVSVPLPCSDPDGVDTLEPDIASQPQNGVLGSVTDENTVFYTPNTNFTGTDTFTFTANDGTSDSNAATVTITVGEDGGGGGGSDPEITNLAVSPKRFKRGSALPQLSAATGTTISFNLDENASTRLSFSRQRPGRRAGGKCRKPTRKNKGNRKCKRFVRAGSFAVDAKTGDNSVRFQGRLSSRKRLKLGRYRMTAQATDADGNRSNRPRVSFRVTRR